MPTLASLGIWDFCGKTAVKPLIHLPVVGGNTPPSSLAQPLTCVGCILSAASVHSGAHGTRDAFHGIVFNEQLAYRTGEGNWQNRNTTIAAGWYHPKASRGSFGKHLPF